LAYPSGQRRTSFETRARCGAFGISFHSSLSRRGLNHRLPGPLQRTGRSVRREPVARRPSRLTLSKLGVRDRTRAVLKAFELQLV